MAREDRDERTRKIGDQALKAMASLGLEELRNSMFHGSNVVQHSTEPGMWGDRSFGDVSTDRAQDRSPSSLADHIRQAEQSRGGREQESPELSRE